MSLGGKIHLSSVKRETKNIALDQVMLLAGQSGIASWVIQYASARQETSY